MTEDWQQRPNLGNPIEGTGPNREGLARVAKGITSEFSGVKFEFKDQLICGNTVVIRSKFTGTVKGPPPGMTELPQWPGVPAEKVLGKSFEIMTLDVHIIKNGLIARTWHLENWAPAFAQMLTGAPPNAMENPPIGPGEDVKYIPQSVKIFFDRLLSDPSGDGQNPQVIAQAITEDWNTRPNFFNLEKGDGPTRQNFTQLTGTFGIQFSKFDFTRMQTLLCGDKVVVISKWDATIKGPVPGMDIILPWVGIPAEKLIGKSFSTWAIDIDTIRNGLIKQTWHIEDYSSALVQMINGSPTQDFGFEKSFFEL